MDALLLWQFEEWRQPKTWKSLRRVCQKSGWVTAHTTCYPRAPTPTSLTVLGNYSTSFCRLSTSNSVIGCPKRPTCRLHNCFASNSTTDDQWTSWILVRKLWNLQQNSFVKESLSLNFNNNFCGNCKPVAPWKLGIRLKNSLIRLPDGKIVMRFWESKQATDFSWFQSFGLAPVTLMVLAKSMKTSSKYSMLLSADAMNSLGNEESSSPSTCSYLRRREVSNTRVSFRPTLKSDVRSSWFATIQLYVLPEKMSKIIK